MISEETLQFSANPNADSGLELTQKPVSYKILASLFAKIPKNGL